MHDKTRVMSFLGFDPLSLLPLMFLSTLHWGQVLPQETDSPVALCPIVLQWMPVLIYALRV